MTLIIDLTPKPKMHVYAPGQPGYIPVAVTLDATPDLKAQPAGSGADHVLLRTAERNGEGLRQAVSDYPGDHAGLSQDLRRRATAKETLTITGRWPTRRATTRCAIGRRRCRSPGRWR